jgi:hypothetical protein
MSFVCYKKLGLTLFMGSSFFSLFEVFSFINGLFVKHFKTLLRIKLFKLDIKEINRYCKELLEDHPLQKKILRMSLRASYGLLRARITGETMAKTGESGK